MVTRTISVSLPEEMIERMDRERNDVTRSKFLVRLIESAYAKKKAGGSG